MYGIGIFKGLTVTFKHLVATFVDDMHWFGRRNTQETFQVKQSLKGKGMYTVQYPEEKIAVPERFRFIPFLVTYNQDDPEYPGKDWCTSCGICAKVCPPQCIWIVRGTNPETGRPKPEPEQFYIDIDICMNCGYCAEYCPFDAIKMDHDYELASYDRTGAHIRDHAELIKPISYWEHIAPTTAAEEQAARGGYDHTDVQKARKKAGLTASRPGPVTDKPQAAPAAVAAPAPGADTQQRAPTPTPVAEAPTSAVAAPSQPTGATTADGKPIVRRRNASPAAKTGGAAPPAPAPAKPTVASAPAPDMQQRVPTPTPAPPPVAQAAPPQPAQPAAAAPAAEPAAKPAPDPNKPVVVRRRNAPPPKKD
ncbi:MAG: 4Fe-4S binding protein [Aggregatilineales bacterium]